MRAHSHSTVSVLCSAQRRHLCALVASALFSLPAVADGQLPASAVARLATEFSQCKHFFPAGLPPVVPQAPMLRELCYSAFAVLHSGETKTPVFVVQHLNRAMILQANDQRRSKHFFSDLRLPSAERAELGDYKRSGYTRGHMAPAGDMNSPDAMAQSFSLANMAPQDEQLNGGAWNTIEQDTRKYVLRAQADVYVFTGPVFVAPTHVIGPGEVHVPQYFFKLVRAGPTGRPTSPCYAPAPRSATRNWCSAQALNSCPDSLRLPSRNIHKQIPI